MLTYLRSNNVTPDFLICHDYAPGDGDTCNLLWTQTWAGHATSMRMMLNDYLGTNLAANVELNGTEFGPEGDKQWISLVGGLFYADMIGQILQTEFNTLLWWDLRNGQSAMTDSDNALYGWRTNSSGNFITDEGCVNGMATPPNRYPSFYCMKLMQYFARGGDTVVAATNDYELLSAYAVRRTNGCLTMLVVNKSSYASPQCRHQSCRLRAVHQRDRLLLWHPPGRRGAHQHSGRPTSRRQISPSPGRTSTTPLRPTRPRCLCSTRPRRHSLCRRPSRRPASSSSNCRAWRACRT